MDHNKDTYPEKPLLTPEKSKKRIPVIWIILVIVLAGAIGYLWFTYSDLKQQSAEEKAELERQKVQLEDELKDIYSQYDSLKTENDTMNLKLQAEQARIEKLLKINANNVYKIRMYEKELGTIRKVLKSYVVQIDSLNLANQELRAENLEVRQELRRVESEKQELTEVRNELSSKVEMASVLSAKNIVIASLNKRSKEINKTIKVEKLRICFTLRENPILEPGPKIIFMRVVRPDDVILTSGVNFFDFQGEQIVFTASREVSYENVDVDMCIFWNNDGQLVPGTYQVQLYADGHEIGSSSFGLR
jgi:flagellar basal body-associated protein FliL